MPNKIVVASAKRARRRSPSRKYPFDKLRVAEDQTRVTKLNSGRPKGLIGFTPTGGHSAPVMVPGAQAICPHAQKNLKKKQTSEVINKITEVVRHAVTPSV